MYIGAVGQPKRHIQGILPIPPLPYGQLCDRLLDIRFLISKMGIISTEDLKITWGLTELSVNCSCYYFVQRRI